jgi:hypothetical protein
MGFDNFFENDRRNNENYRDNRYNEDNRYQRNSYPSDQEDREQFNISAFLEKIKSNKKLKLLVIIAIILILVIVVALIIILFPLIMKLFNYISQNGLQGVIDSIAGFADKVMKGSAK